MKNSCLALVLTALVTMAPCAAQNPVYRANRSFYTSMWTANPPEYTNAGQSVAAGTMHWRAFLHQANQRIEPRRIVGLGTWWQPSDEAGTFPRNVDTPEFRAYPTTFDGGGLVIPDLSRPPLFSVPPMTLTVPTGGPFKSLTMNFAAPIVLTNVTDFAICGVYPQGANSTTPGFFGFLPSAANETFQLQQSYYGFAYPNGTITHFPLGGARSSIWFLDEQPTMSARGNWAVTDAHFQAGHQNNAFGDQTYFAPLSDSSWPGWNDSRAATSVGLTVFAAGHDGDFMFPLLNFGARFLAGVQLRPHTFEIYPADPVLGLLFPLTGTVQNGRFDLTLPLTMRPAPWLRGLHFGFEGMVVSSSTLTILDTTQSVWLRM